MSENTIIGDKDTIFSGNTQISPIFNNYIHFLVFLAILREDALTHLIPRQWSQPYAVCPRSHICKKVSATQMGSDTRRDRR